MRHLMEDIILSDAVMGLGDAESLTIARVEVRCDDGIYIFYIFNHTVFNTLHKYFQPFIETVNMSAAQFKTVFQGAGWDQHNSQELVAVHQINSMTVLRMATPKRASRTINAIKKPDGAKVGLQVTESAEHGLIWLAIIARNSHRVSRNLTTVQLKNAFTDVDKYSVHHIQHQLEES